MYIGILYMLWTEFLFSLPCLSTALRKKKHKFFLLFNPILDRKINTNYLISSFLSRLLPLKKDRLLEKQGRKRPLDTPKRMIKRREREGKREKEM